MKNTLVSYFGSVCKFYSGCNPSSPRWKAIRQIESTASSWDSQAWGQGQQEKQAKQQGLPAPGDGSPAVASLGTTRQTAASSKHLLVQDEVEIESPIASWSPVLAACPVPGAHEHERSHAESPQARTQTPRAVHAAAGALASLASAGPQGLAIRGRASRRVPWLPGNARKQLSRKVQGFHSGFRRFCAGVSGFRDPRALYSVERLDSGRQAAPGLSV